MVGWRVTQSCLVTPGGMLGFSPLSCRMNGHSLERKEAENCAAQGDTDKDAQEASGRISHTWAFGA